MPSLVETLRWLTLIAWMVWFVGYWDGGRRVFGEIRGSFHKNESQRDMWLMLAIVFLSFIIIATGFLVTAGLPFSPSGFNNVAIITLGTTLTLLGMGGTVYCRRYLDRFWAANMSLENEHPVVVGDPYNHVRHPISTGAIIMYTGTVLVFPSWWNFIATLLVILIYVLKTIDEERFLEVNLTGYAHYQQRVPYRLLPKIW